MPSDPNIGKREREVLTAIVETFISTGEPVGSRTLSRSNREGLSPASIRNVMADLVGRGISGAAACLRGTRADHRGVPLLRGADFRERRSWRRRKRP
jgi:heat-inducible transcriptional repressor